MGKSTDPVPHPSGCSEVDQSGDKQPANPAKHDAQNTLLKSKTPGQVGYEPYAYHLGDRGSQVQVLSARRQALMRVGSHQGFVVSGRRMMFVT